MSDPFDLHLFSRVSILEDIASSDVGKGNGRASAWVEALNIILSHEKRFDCNDRHEDRADDLLDRGTARVASF